MNLHVEIEGKNIILQLAKIIINDWKDTIKESCGQFVSETTLPEFNVLLVEDSNENINKMQVRNSFDLVIILEGANMHPFHILALSQQLSMFGQNSQPFAPLYVAQLTIANCIAIATLQHLFARIQATNRQSKNTIIHRLNCIECVKYFGAFNVSARASKMYSNRRGKNILDGGAPFYSIYRTKSGQLAVGNLQSKFYVEMLKAMDLPKEEMEFCLENQMNFESWDKIRRILGEKFMERTAGEWQQAMKLRDTCVTEIKQWNESVKHQIHPSFIKPKI